MREPVVAFAVSSRSWSDRFHRFLADHGGARVRLSVLHPDDVIAEDYDVLLIDDICSFLTPRLVMEVLEKGRRLLGVFDAEYPSGRTRLRDCGIELMVEASAEPEEFLQYVNRALEGMVQRPEEAVTVEPGQRVSQDEVEQKHGTLLAVGGPPGGAGITEVALALSLSLVKGERSVLIDADPAYPILGPRLGVPPLPNLRSLVDRMEHHGVDSPLPEQTGLTVIPGGTGAAGIDGAHPQRVSRFIESLANPSQPVVVDTGTAGAQPDFRRHLPSMLLRVATHVVAVTTGQPPGIIRLLDWLTRLHQIRPESPAMVVFNRSMLSVRRRAQLVNEVERTYPVAGVLFLPEDPLVREAVWVGERVARGPFTRSINRLAEWCQPLGKVDRDR